mmetsp:Transcript_15747/g.44825  ORF Transcript_15747/g.44825 Transcript_15747/m.44825 type:complete len:474 (+) Transcript_15747:102-1523(+)
MAASIRLRAKASSYSPHVRALWQFSVLAACVAIIGVDAARLEGYNGNAIGSGGGSGVTACAAAPVQTRIVTKATGGRGVADLRVADRFVDAINVESPLTLSTIRDILYRFEDLRMRVLCPGLSRKLVANTKAKRILRDMNEKKDILTRLASQKESQGEVDDGDEIPPSRRENICKTIEFHAVGSDFRDDIWQLCRSLDKLRAAVSAGESAEKTVFEVSGLMRFIRKGEEYALPLISGGLTRLLEQECRWAARRLAAPGAPIKSPTEGDEVCAGIFRSWTNHSEACAVRPTTIRQFYSAVEGIDPDEYRGFSLSLIRTTLLRLELLEDEVAERIADCADPSTRGRLRDVSRRIKSKSDALQALADQAMEAGETDSVFDALPSERTTVCKSLDEYRLSPEVRHEVAGVCSSLDRLRTAVLAGGDEEDAAYMEVVGRLTALKSRPDYMNLDIAGELELAFAEEWHVQTGRDKSVQD